jgi:hypothetical protein
MVPERVREGKPAIHQRGQLLCRDVSVLTCALTSGLDSTLSSSSR